jgi:hypothetical protein
MDAVASGLGDFLGRSDARFRIAEAPLRLGANLPVVELARDDQARGGQAAGADTRVVETGAQFYQVFSGEVAIGFAIARGALADGVVIDSYSLSTEALSIARAMHVVDVAGIPDTYEARILDERARNVGAIVLVGSQAGHTLVVPFRVPVRQGRLAVDQVYPLREFAQALAELPVAGGLLVPRRDDGLQP